MKPERSSGAQVTIIYIYKTVAVVDSEPACLDAGIEPMTPGLAVRFTNY